MEIKIDTDKPWIKQVEEAKVDLYEKALIETKGNATKASKMLGISARNMRNLINKHDRLRKVSNRLERKEYSIPFIKALFELGLQLKDIGSKVGIKSDTVRSALESNYDKDTYEKLKQARKYMDTQKILDNNMLILSHIADMIKNGKIDELTDEYMFYAKVLFANGLMNQDGTITEEGKSVLYQ